MSINLKNIYSLSIIILILFLTSSTVFKYNMTRLIEICKKRHKDKDNIIFSRAYSYQVSTYYLYVKVQVMRYIHNIFKWECLGSLLCFCPSVIFTLPILAIIAPKTRVQLKSFLWKVHFIPRSMLLLFFSRLIIIILFFSSLS